MTLSSSLDVSMAVVLMVGMPLNSTASFRSLQRKLAGGDRRALVREYWWTIAIEWGLVVGLAIMWMIASRPAAWLGLTIPPGRETWIGVGATVLGLLFLLAQWRSITSLDGPGLEILRKQVAPVAALFPADEREHRVFRLLAITAGICEELLFRGFLIYFASLWMNPWLAMCLCAIVFGIGHAYQGRAGMLKTTIVGLLMGVLYLSTGSILWPVILHIVIDLQGGAVGRMIGAGAAEAPPSASPSNSR